MVSIQVAAMTNPANARGAPSARGGGDASLETRCSASASAQENSIASSSAGQLPAIADQPSR